MHHATQALGGISVKVKEQDFENALAVLAEMKREPSDSRSPGIAEQADGWLKRAGYAAVIGSFLLPVISNAYAFYLYAKAVRMDSACVKRHRTMFVVGIIFNSFMCIVWLFAGALYLEGGRFI